jgi:DNA-binding NtrC family response regulator
MTLTIPQSKPSETPLKTSVTQRVLILDDEPAILFAYRKMIENEGMAVDISANLADAVSLISSRTYLAVVVDVRLTGTDNEDGLEFLRILRNVHPATKMILATGFGNNEIRENARRLGAEHYFEKPVQPSAIINALKSFTVKPVKTTP